MFLGKFAYDILLEVGLIVLYPLLSVTLQIGLQKPRFRNEGQVIVIVERWLSLNIRHIFWKRYLERRGFRVYLINLPLWRRDFSDSSMKLSEYIDQFQLSDIILVGISSGAISALLYLQEKNGWRKVKKFISIGAPFNGTYAILFLSFLPSGRELLPGSKLIKKIQSYSNFDPGKVICIKAKFDEMVPSGSILKGAKKITLNIFGHNNLHLHNKKTYKIIIENAKESS